MKIPILLHTSVFNYGLQCMTSDDSAFYSPSPLIRCIVSASLLIKLDLAQPPTPPCPCNLASYMQYGRPPKLLHHFSFSSEQNLQIMHQSGLLSSLRGPKQTDIKFILDLRLDRLRNSKGSRSANRPFHCQPALNLP